MFPYVILLGLAVTLSFAGRLMFRAASRPPGRDLSSLREAAQADQTDRIHLIRSTENWKSRAAAQPFVEPLIFKGFADAGAYRISEIPGVLLHLLVQKDDSILAVTYEHDKAGSWIDLITFYNDGGKFTYTTLEDPGLENRPNHMIARAPSVDSLTLYSMTLAARPQRGVRSIAVSDAVHVFEQSYADWVAWRKARNVLEGRDSGREAA